jgi:hypothetical protein
MTIPENFELAPVKAGTHPPPAPAECQKRQLYSNIDVEAQFAAIDTHAVEVKTAAMPAALHVQRFC